MNREAPAVDAPSVSSRRQLPTWFARMSGYSWGFVGIVAAAAVLVVGLAALRELVVPLLLAAFLAIILEPVVGWLADRRVPRGAGAALVIFAIGLVGIAVVAFVAVGVAGESDQISDRLIEAESEVKGYIDRSEIGDYVDQIGDSLEGSGQTARDGIGSEIGTLLDTAAGLASGLVLGIVLLFYLLKDGAALTKSYIASRRATDREQYERIFAQAARSIRGYFRGTTVLALVQGVFIAIVLAIMGVPLAGSIGVVNFAGAYVPYLGAFVGGAFAVLMALSGGGLPLALGAIAVLLFTNLVLENVLQPKLVGSSLNLHPVVVLISTVVGGVAAGIVGLILAAPLTSIGINLFKDLSASGFFDDEVETSQPQGDPAK